jgi:hypothetical protein
MLSLQDRRDAQLFILNNTGALQSLYERGNLKQISISHRQPALLRPALDDYATIENLRHQQRIDACNSNDINDNVKKR